MKKILIQLVLVFFSLSSFATTKESISNSFSHLAEVKELPSNVQKLNLKEFLSLTPEKYKEMTGQKLGVVNSMKLKAAQKVVKDYTANGAPMEKSIYILLAIFGLAWIAMGLADDWKGSDWVVNLILTLLCWLPGLIHALVKMKKYYPS